MKTNHFNASAKSWDTEETIRRNAALACAIEKYLPKDQKAILDFGCGTGLLSEHFIERSEVLIGIDTSAGMLEQFDHRFKDHSQAKSLLLNLETESIPDGIGPFHVIMTAMAFHHLKAPLKVLEKMKRHLDPKGRIFVIDLDQEDGTFHPDNAGMGVEHYGFSQNEFETWAKELGFNYFHHEIIYQISKNNREYGIGLAVYGS